MSKTNDSKPVFSLTEVQEEYVKDNPHSSWNVLHDALWRTPFTDYTDEWISVAMYRTKRFLFQTFQKAVETCPKKSFRFVPIDNENWPGYDHQAINAKRRINLLQRE
jgi:hypothetical protein